LLLHGVYLSLDLCAVVAKSYLAAELVCVSIHRELINASSLRSRPVTEGIGAISRLFTADELDRTLVEPISEG